MYSAWILNKPELASKYKVKQAEQASYYERIIRNIDVFLQMDQVCHIHEGLPQVPSPRYVPSRDELKNDNIRHILQSAHGDMDLADKETQIIHLEFVNENDYRINHLNLLSRLWNIDDLTDMGFNITECSLIPTIGDPVPQTPAG